MIPTIPNGSTSRGLWPTSATVLVLVAGCGLVVRSPSRSPRIFCADSRLKRRRTSETSYTRNLELPAPMTRLPGIDLAISCVEGYTTRTP